MFAITDNGLRKIGVAMAIKPGYSLHLGASSSPDHVVVTRVEAGSPGFDDKVYYVSWHGSYRKESMCQARIFSDLARQGMQTWINTYGKYHPTKVATYRKILAGRPLDASELEKPEDYYRWEVVCRAKVKGVDLWREAERWGSVGGIDDPETGEMLYEIRLDRRSLDAAEVDPKFCEQFEIQSRREMPPRD